MAASLNSPSETGFEQPSWALALLESEIPLRRIGNGVPDRLERARHRRNWTSRGYERELRESPSAERRGDEALARRGRSPLKPIRELPNGGLRTQKWLCSAGRPSAESFRHSVRGGYGNCVYEGGAWCIAIGWEPSVHRETSWAGPAGSLGNRAARRRFRRCHCPHGSVGSAVRGMAPRIRRCEATRARA